MENRGVGKIPPFVANRKGGADEGYKNRPIKSMKMFRGRATGDPQRSGDVLGSEPTSMSKIFLPCT